MSHENAVLSLNPDRQSLLHHESALRENGFAVISVYSPLQARFEIEMGRCGVFLTSCITPLVIYQDLATLFKRSCPSGLVAYVARRPEDGTPVADILLYDQDEPYNLVERLRSMQAARAG
jgi:hypothetical protein